MKGRRRRRKKGSACFERDRLREKERKKESEEKNKSNKSRVLLSISCGPRLPTFLSPVDEQEFTLTNGNETETPLPPFPFDQPRQSVNPCDLTKQRT